MEQAFKKTLTDFYHDFPEGRIVTELAGQTTGLHQAIVKAAVYRNKADQLPAATAHICKPALTIEEAETAAIRRALELFDLCPRANRVTAAVLMKLSDVPVQENAPLAKKEIPAITKDELTMHSNLKQILTAMGHNGKVQASLNHFSTRPTHDQRREYYYETLRKAILWVISAQKLGLSPEGTDEYLLKFGIDKGVNSASEESLDKCVADVMALGHL